MKLLFIAIAAVHLLAGCSSDNFQGETRETESIYTSNTRSGDKKPSEAGPTELVVEDESKEDTVLEPIMVGGAFLTCRFDEGVRCRLDHADKENLEIPEDVTIKFYNTETELNHTAIVNSTEWKWDVDWPKNENGIIVLELTRDKQQLLYQAELITSPLQVGDGTSMLSGCTSNQVSTSEIVGVTYEKDFLITEEGSYQLTLYDVCGVARDNDSYFMLTQILDSGDETLVFKEFLSRTNEPMDFSTKTKELPPGIYRLSLVSGDMFDIDDFFVNGIIWSRSKNQ